MNNNLQGLLYSVWKNKLVIDRPYFTVRTSRFVPDGTYQEIVTEGLTEPEARALAALLNEGERHG